MKKIITENEYNEISKAEEKAPECAIHRKIIAVKMVMESASADEITKYTGYNSNYVYEIVARNESNRAMLAGNSHRRL